MVLDADIILCVPLYPCIMKADLSQLSLNDPPITAIAISSSTDLSVCASASYDAWYGGIQMFILKGV